MLKWLISYKRCFIILLLCLMAASSVLASKGIRPDFFSIDLDRLEPDGRYVEQKFNVPFTIVVQCFPTINAKSGTIDVSLPDGIHSYKGTQHSDFELIKDTHFYHKLDIVVKKSGLFEIAATLDAGSVEDSSIRQFFPKVVSLFIYARPDTVVSSISKEYLEQEIRDSMFISKEAKITRLFQEFNRTDYNLVDSNPHDTVPFPLYGNMPRTEDDLLSHLSDQQRLYLFKDLALPKLIPHYSMTIGSIYDTTKARSMLSKQSQKIVQIIRNNLSDEYKVNRLIILNVFYYGIHSEKISELIKQRKKIRKKLKHELNAVLYP